MLVSFRCFLLSSNTKSMVQWHFPQQKCKMCLCYPWNAMIKTADINSNECKTKTDFHFQCHCLCDIVSLSFFTHLKPIWFEKYLYLYRKGEQRNIYVKTFHSVYIAHHWVVEYKIVIFTQRYILIIIFGVFR